MDATEKLPPSVEQYAAGHLRDRIQGVAARLRDLAERVDRFADDVSRVGGPGRSSYANVAAEVQHEVLWGLANLSLDGLTQAAETPDLARARRLAAEAIADQIEAGGTLDGERWQDKAASIARDYAAKEG